MTETEPTDSDIAQWIQTLLPAELWKRYCHLPYSHMARIPELAAYADSIREADRRWYRAYQATRSSAAVYELRSDDSNRV